jgi:hypothetical protein
LPTCPPISPDVLERTGTIACGGVPEKAGSAHDSGVASPRKSSTACRANGIFCENFGQRIGELVIEDQNIRAASHVFIACTKREDVMSLLTRGLKASASPGWLFLRDVRYWPKADIGPCTAHVRFRG